MFIKQLDLKLSLPGYYKFFSSFVYLDDNEDLFIIDTGPSCTIPIVCAAVKELTFKSITLLLTHVHVDHAGGAAKLYTVWSELYTTQRLKVCYLHDRAIPHLRGPERLWQGTVATLGQELSHIMGCPEPFPEAGEVIPPFLSSEFKASDSLQFYRELKSDGKKIIAIPTPGHALHHVNYVIDDTMFVGESLGVIYPGTDYLRPATPPVFKRSVYEASIERIKHLTNSALAGVTKHAYAHFGIVEAQQSNYDYALWQIRSWCDYVAETKQQRSLSEYLGDIDKHIQNLASFDKRCAEFYKLPEDVQQRERKFIGNTLSGIFG